MTTPKEIFDTQIAQKISADPAKAKSIGAVYKFVVTGDNGGTWVVNAKDNPGVTEGDSPADCTITVGADDFVNMSTGKANPQQLFMQGKVKLQGSMPLAMKLGQILG